MEFADRWRLGYKPTMDKVRKGEIPWTRLDDVHRIILEELLSEFKIDGLTEAVSYTHLDVYKRQPSKNPISITLKYIPGASDGRSSFS